MLGSLYHGCSGYRRHMRGHDGSELQCRRRRKGKTLDLEVCREVSAATFSEFFPHRELVIRVTCTLTLPALARPFYTKIPILFDLTTLPFWVLLLLSLTKRKITPVLL
jgi:hypothetical protein